MEDTTTTAVTEAAPVSTPSAPSGDESASAPSTPARPASFKEALAQTAAKTESTGTATIAPSVSADGTAIKKGPIPFEVHDTALQNARAKSAAERDAEWTNRVGWAANIDRERAAQALHLADLLDRSPAEFIDRAVAQLVNDPQQAASVRSALARHLASGRSAPAEAPLPSIQLEDGTVIDLNSFRDSIQKQTLQAATQQFQPAMDAAKELQEAKEFAVRQHHAGQFAQGFMGTLTQLPGFKAHAKEIHAALAQTKLETDHPAEVRAAAYEIYHRIVVPTLSQAGQASLMASLKQKAVAQTESPSRTATASGARPKNTADLAKFMAQKYAERG